MLRGAGGQAGSQVPTSAQTGPKDRNVRAPGTCPEDALGPRLHGTGAGAPRRKEHPHPHVRQGKWGTWLGRTQQHLSTRGRDGDWGLQGSPTGKGICASRSTQGPKPPSGRPSGKGMRGDKRVGPGQHTPRLSIPHTQGDPRWRQRTAPRKGGGERGWRSLCRGGGGAPGIATPPPRHQSNQDRAQAAAREVSEDTWGRRTTGHGRLMTGPQGQQPEDPGGAFVIKGSTAGWRQPSLAGAWWGGAHLLELPAVRHRGHHLRELLFLTLEHAVNVLHRHLGEPEPQTSRAARPPAALPRAPILGTAQQGTQARLPLASSSSRAQAVGRKATPNASARAKPTSQTAAVFHFLVRLPKYFYF